MSKKRSALMRSIKKERADFLLEFPFCCVCGSPGELAVHEMAKGNPHREAALTQRMAWLAVCSFCNCGVLCDYSVFPLCRQLALKKIFDPAHYDLAAFNVLRGRAPYAISQAEVSRWVRKEKKRVA